MPVKIKTDLEWGDLWYIKNDPEQLEHLLVGLMVLPGNQIKFMLSYQGDICTVWDFECSKTIDKNKVLDISSKNDDED